RLQVGQQHLLDLVLDESLRLAFELVSAQALPPRLELVGRPGAPVIAAEADLGEGLRIEVEDHALHRIAVAPEDHGAKQAAGPRCVKETSARPRPASAEAEQLVELLGREVVRALRAHPA